ncbi:MAG: thiamine phosphate synthase [Candidatus Pseudobacter hemicellulosilyticus]|uniref:Thiamine phosphate synthase n=1 Tax=Candidatus Pseudobacter hemicellulosilyticus TaxID=3121375 RepID=A0AAJ5WTT3_9BACT|nr:MAG: thiamine phosphate synthase [Pseudobacter sp.]
MNRERTISGGVYLVLDPAREQRALLTITRQVLAGGIAVIQLWNHWLPGQDKKAFISEVCTMAHEQGVPVLINEEWELVLDTDLDGVHFDEFPQSLSAIRQQAGRTLQMGLTCGNDLDRIRRGIDEGFDYLSFCALFPSRSANSCELVRPETIKAARQMSRLPIFVSGGITPENLQSLAGTGLDGVAVISGILDAPDPAGMVQQYKQSISNVNNKQV